MSFLFKLVISVGIAATLWGIAAWYFLLGSPDATVKAPPGDPSITTYRLAFKDFSIEIENKSVKSTSRKSVRANTFSLKPTLVSPGAIAPNISQQPVNDVLPRKRITFKQGAIASEVSDQLGVDQIQDFLLNARQGQKLQIDSKDKITVKTINGQLVNGTIPITGDIIVSVQPNPNCGDKSCKIVFKITIQ